MGSAVNFSRKSNVESMRADSSPDTKLRTYARSCSRPGCIGEPIATMSYDQAGAAVFVGQLTAEREPSMYDLCRRHLDALTAPRGWVIRREPLAMAGEGNELWHSPVQSRARGVVGPLCNRPCRLRLRRRSPVNNR